MRLALWLIDRLEARTGEDMDYARELARESPGGFWKFVLTGPLLRHRGRAPETLFHLARLGAMQVEDCGPCLQTVVREARRRGLPAQLLRSALAGGSQLPPRERDAYLLGREVAGDAAPDPGWRERLEAAIGRRGVVELTVAAASVRIFPAIKRGTGYARSCALVEVEV